MKTLTSTYNTTASWQWLLVYSVLIVCDTASQCLFKAAALHTGPASLDHWPAFVDFILTMLQQPALLAGVLSLLLAFGCWMWLMARAELSRAHLISCLVYASVPLCSVLLFAESISDTQLLGIALITAGAALSAWR